MKYMVASDIHGSAHWCRELLKAFDAGQADRLVLLGDLLYHGPRNPLPREYDPMEVAAMLNERRSDLLCVRGNCDCPSSRITPFGPWAGGWFLQPTAMSTIPKRCRL